MFDKLIMENYLLVLKSTVEVYVHGTLESSNASNKALLKSSLNSILDSQENTYTLMTKYGWYKVNNVPSSKIQSTIDNINSN